jgi:hypothetical protein
MRLGEVSSLGWSIFRAIEREVQYEDDIKPTELLVQPCGTNGLLIIIQVPITLSSGRGQ